MIARQLGAQGFIIFSYNLPTAGQHMPALRKGLLADQ